MIRWNSNKAGFPGNSIHFIKSVFRQVFSKTSEAPGSEDLECVVIALITDPGEVVKLAINDVETVVAAGIVEETVVIGIINDSGKVVKTPINDTEVVVKTELNC